MADSSWPTLVEVKEYLGVDASGNDVYLQQQMDATVLSIEHYCGRYFEAMDTVEDFRFTDFDKNYAGINGVRLKRIPIQDITSIQDASGNDISTEWMRGENGFVLGNFPRYENFLTVTYRGGFEDEIPADVLDVYYRMTTIRNSVKDYTVPLSGNLKNESIPNVMTMGYYNTGSDSTKTGYGLSSPDNFSYTLDNYVHRDF